MDRRRALQSLAGGSIVATTLIQSAPAFAYDSPIVSGSLNASITTLPGNERAIVTLTSTSATCPSSATSTTTARTLTLTKTFSGVQLVFTVPGNVEITPGGTVIAGAPTSVTIEKRRPDGVTPNTWWPGNGSGNNNRIRVEISETHTCTYSDMTQRSVTNTYDHNFFYQSGGAWI